jgi:hypothetical protein
MSRLTLSRVLMAVVLEASPEWWRSGSRDEGSEVQTLNHLPIGRRVPRYVGSRATSDRSSVPPSTPAGQPMCDSPPHPSALGLAWNGPQTQMKPNERRP